MERRINPRLSHSLMTFLLLVFMAIGSVVGAMAQTTIEQADANGNILLYSYESDTSPATFTGIKTYAADEAKAGRIIIADAVTDASGKTHTVKYVGGSLSNRSNIVSVVLGKNIETLGESAFYSCSNLTTVTFDAASAITAIPVSCFQYCGKLQAVTLPNSVKTIGDYAYYYCENVTEITIPSSVETFGGYVFYHCSKVETINYYAASVPNYFFTGSSSLKTINIGKNVKTIGDYAFQSNSGVTAVNFDADVSNLTIGESAFSSLSSLTTLTLPKGVVSLGNSAFYSCSNLTTVTFDAASVITTIPVSCFQYCGKLTAVTLPNSVKTIDDYAYYYCDNLTEITIPSSVETFGGYVFYHCSKVETINYYAASVPNSFFTGSSSLKTINIGKDVKTIGDYAFQSNSGVTAVNFDADVSGLSIGESAFSNLSSLTTLTLPKGIASLGSSAFSSCYNLTTVTFDAASVITAIPNGCFQYCNKLQVVTFPNSVQTIGNSAFYYCDNLREITFGTGLANGGFSEDYYLFYNCGKMEKMTIPSVNYPFKNSYGYLPDNMIIYVRSDMLETYTTNSYTSKYHIIAIGSETEYDVTTTEGGQLVTKVPAEVAGNVLKLTISGPINGTDINQIHELMPFLEELNLTNAQIVAGGEEYYRYSISNNKPSKQTSYHYATANNVIGDYMFYNMPYLKKLSLPNGATAIGNYAMANNKNLTLVNMPSALTTIGEYAFSNNTKMAKADIPSTVTAIGKYGFYKTGIETLTIPDGVTRIEEATFQNCESLVSATLSDNITFIGNQAFYNCSKLESVNIPTKVESIGEDAFCNNNKLASPIVIPATCKSIGKWAFDDNYLIPSVTLNEGLETIGDYAFQNCDQLEGVTLPQSLTSLGNYAFYDCASLKQMTFPTNIKQVSDYVLANCTSLESVTLAVGTTKIGNSAFSGCKKLATTTNLNQTTLTALGNDVFNGTALTTVTLPNTITSMGSSVFYNCKSLESANIPTGITTIPGSAFRYCEKLTSVTIHDGITSISAYAFDGCKLLPSIALNNQITTIANYAFRNCESLVLTTLPTALTSIGYQTFYNTKAITGTLTLPETLTTLGEEAFKSSGITGIVIPKTITNFGTEVFYNCASLASVTLPNDMTKIPNYTFYGTTALKTITLPTALEEIGYEAFYNSGLTEINLPKSLLKIDDLAFYNTQISEIKVPKNVTYVGSQFAANCKQLKTAWLGRKQDYSNNSEFNYFTGCDNLELLRVYAGTPPKISTSTIWMENAWKGHVDYRTKCVLEVPEGQIDIYTATDTWKEFKEIKEYESPEMLNDADYAVLTALYNNLDGANWTKPWKMTQNHSNGKWQGVSTVVDPEDDELFYITDIDLTERGLAGTLPKSLFTLSHLKTINLSHNTIVAKVDELMDNENTVITEVNMEGNHLKGDLYPFVSKLPNLTSLNVSYNWLTAYSQKTSNEKLDNYYMRRGYQFVDWKTKEVVVPEELMDEVVIDYTPGVPIEIESNTLQVYRHEYGDYNLSFNYLYPMYKDGSSMYYTSEGELYKQASLWDANSSYVFKAPKNQLVAYTHTMPYYSYITYIFRITWKDGDVNADQTVDVADLQSVVYYALNDGKPSGEIFNYTTADANNDSKINVSDIIGSVDYVLNYKEPEVSPARKYNKEESDSRNLITINGSTLMLANADEVAALQLTISGVSQSQLQVAQDMRSRFTVSMRNADDGVRLVIYSPAGNTLAPGESLLLNSLPAGAVITDARLVDSNAARLSVSFDSTTSINELSADALRLETTPVYDLSGRPVGNWDSLPAGIYIVKLNGKQFKVRK